MPPPHTYPRRPEAQTMLSPLKQEKIIKQRAVNSFPASLGPLRGRSPTPTPTNTPHTHTHQQPSKLQYSNPRVGSSLKPEDRTESTLGRRKALCWLCNLGSSFFLITQGQTEQAPLSYGETEAWEWLKVIRRPLDHASDLGPYYPSGNLLNFPSLQKRPVFDGTAPN